MLKEQLEKRQKEMTSQAPQEVLNTMRGATLKLIESGIDKQSLKKGDVAPEFVLPNVNGKMISSKELLKKGPLIVSFNRGGWCPYCNLEIAAWKRYYNQVKESGAELISISPNIVKKSLETKEKYGVEFDILSDAGNKVAKQFGLVFTLSSELHPLYKAWGIDIPEYNGDESYELPIPATYVIKNNRIIYSFVNADYTKRAEPSEVLANI